MKIVNVIVGYNFVIDKAGYLLQIMLSPDARSTAWVSFDGRNQQELCADDRSVNMKCRIIFGDRLWAQ